MRAHLLQVVLDMSAQAANTAGFREDTCYAASFPMEEVAYATLHEQAPELDVLLEEGEEVFGDCQQS